MLSWCVAITIFGIVCFDLRVRFQENAQSQIILIRDDERNEKSKCIP